MFGLLHELPQCFAFQCSGPLPTNTFFPLHFSCYFPFTILHPRVVPCTLVCAPVSSCSPAPWCNSLRPAASSSCAASSYSRVHNRMPSYTIVNRVPSCTLALPRTPVPSCTLAAISCAFMYPCVCPPATSCALLHPCVPSCTLVVPRTSCALLQHRVPSCNTVCLPAPLCTLIHPHVPSCTLI